MDILVRTAAIIAEVLLLTAIVYSILKGTRLIAFDLGIAPKYSKAITMMLVAVGLLIVVFFISHLTAFYPVV
ncbi:hypothetical protein ACFLTO_00285 [Chloroflexota bacterium]